MPATFQEAVIHHRAIRNINRPPERRDNRKPAACHPDLAILPFSQSVYGRCVNGYVRAPLRWPASQVGRSTPAVWFSWALDNPPGNAARRPAPGGSTNQERVTNPIAEQRPSRHADGARTPPEAKDSRAALRACAVNKARVPPAGICEPDAWREGAFGAASLCRRARSCLLVLPGLLTRATRPCGPRTSAGWYCQPRWRDKIDCSAKPEALSGSPPSPAGGKSSPSALGPPTSAG
jgi:hypothetical protein